MTLVSVSLLPLNNGPVDEMNSVSTALISFFPSSALWFLPSFELFLSFAVTLTLSVETMVSPARISPATLIPIFVSFQNASDSET